MASIFYNYAAKSDEFPFQIRLSYGINRLARVRSGQIVKKSDWENGEPFNFERNRMAQIILGNLEETDVTKWTNNEVKVWLKSQVDIFENLEWTPDAAIKEDYRHLLSQSRIFAKECGIEYDDQTEQKILDSVISILLNVEPAKETEDGVPPIAEINRVIAFYEAEEKLFDIKMDVTLPALKQIKWELEKYLSPESQVFRTARLLNKQYE